jgi:hypothetical protein
VKEHDGLAIAIAAFRVVETWRGPETQFRKPHGAILVDAAHNITDTIAEQGATGGNVSVARVWAEEEPTGLPGVFGARGEEGISRTSGGSRRSGRVPGFKRQ